jgi:integrase
VKLEDNDKTIVRKRYRSPNGESRPYRDGDRYKLCKTITFPDGTTKKVTGSGLTRMQCEANTAALIKKRLAEFAPQNEPETVLDACQHWLSDVRSLQPMKPKTRAGYQHAIDKSIKPHLGKKKLVDLKRGDIQKMYASLTNAGKSFYVLKEVRAVLNGAMNEAILANKIQVNPVSAVKLPQKPRVKPTYFDTNQAQAILLKAEARGELARWLIAIQLGLRQGECLGLSWEDVELDGETPTITVRKALSRVTGKGLVLDTPKTDSSARTIPLTPPIVRVLREHKRKQMEEKLRSGSKWRTFEHVFTTPAGKPIDPSNDRKAWKELLLAAGVPYKKLHAARHTTATLMHENGVDLLSISHVLGHSSMSTTAAFYAHVPDGTKLKAVTALGEALVIGK